MRVVVGLSGASAIKLGIKLIDEISKKNEIFIIASDMARDILKKMNYQKDIFKNDNLFAPPSSGSFKFDKMIIAPCSINSLAKIANGISDNLLTRVAAVCLKEKRDLILGVREMPFSTISLSNMLRLSKMGVIIAPPVIAEYSGAKNLDELENFIVGKWLDSLKIENNLFKRWK